MIVKINSCKQEYLLGRLCIYNQAKQNTPYHQKEMDFHFLNVSSKITERVRPRKYILQKGQVPFSKYTLQSVVPGSHSVKEDFI